MPTPNVREMVRKALIEGGFDGLFLPDECGCSIDDLSPADCLTEQCQAGYRYDVAAMNAEELAERQMSCEFDYYIAEEKPK